MADTSSRLSGRRIAIYGLGLSTRDFLEQNGAGLNIAGLLDGYQKDGTCFGYPVLSLDSIPDLRVDTIVVIARPSSRHVIVRRIRDFCRMHRIALTDPAGNDLLSGEGAPDGETARIPLPDRERLTELIDTHDVISFDIFDTLLMRYVPAPSDVHALTAHRLYGVFPLRSCRPIPESACARSTCSRGAVFRRSMTFIWKYSRACN